MMGKRLLMAMILLMNMGAVAAQGAEQDPPSIELLEFLGEWETRDGTWVDPMEFKDVVLPDEEQKDEEQKRDEERDS
jgi:hypothetical protein